MKPTFFTLVAAILFALLACNQSMRPDMESGPSQPSGGDTVTASYYGKGDGFDGKKTASGDTMNSQDLTAAHKSYPFGTKLDVINPDNGKKVRVRVNDRGPFVKGRSLDLSPAAADKIGIIDSGVSKVQVKVVAKPPPQQTPPSHLPHP